MLQKRRRSLLTLASYGTWDFDLASFPYVYNSLLPNGSEVVKGKIAKIYANGVIENQIIKNGNFSDGTNGWNINGNDYATYTTTNNQIMFTITVQNDGHWSASKYISTNASTNAINWYANHKYLVVCEAYTEKAGNLGVFYGDDYDSPYTSLEANKWQTVYGFRTQSTNSTSMLQFSPFFVSGMEVGKKYGFRNIRVFDLTLMFGTGKEPTTITDNRIQEILNRGYIAYNQGEYKGTNVGEIATKDINYNVYSIPFIYQGNGALNAHDTFEITSSEYVFTKNIGSVDLSTISWSFNSNYKLWLGLLSTIKTFTVNELANILSNKYQTVLYNEALFNAKYGIGVNTQLLGVYKDSADDGTTAPSGTLTYELATPQVTHIPRKHLGIVDLGILTGSYVSNGVYYIYGDAFGFSQASSNNNGYACYVSRFMRANGNEVYSKTNDNTICLTSPFIGNNLAIYSSSFAGKTADEIRALLSGVYLFYETAEEVDDIATRIFTENGGTVTTNSEVLPNLDLDLPIKV